MPPRKSGLVPVFCNSMYWKSCAVYGLPGGGGAGLYMISVINNGGVLTTHVAAVGPDHGLDSGGLSLAPVMFLWLGSRTRATTRALFVRMIGPLYAWASSEMAPPGRRGSAPFSV